MDRKQRKDRRSGRSFRAIRGEAKMSSRFHKNFARTTGAVLGAFLALLFLVAARPGGNSSPSPATVRVSMAPVGELEVTPSTTPILVADSLLPGGRPADATFRVRNQAGETLAIGLRTTADSTALDGLLRLRLTADGEALADTTLQGLQQRTVSLNLASGAHSRLRLQAWIPNDVNTGFEGRRVEVSLVPTIRIAEGQG